MLKSIQSLIQLARINKPIGIFLLLWPTYWGLWLANKTTPSNKLIIIFTLGVILMRSAGCIINDIADRHLDTHVKRTQQRPLATKKMSLALALSACFILLLFCLALVLQLNLLCLTLAVAGLILTAIYPLCKRFISIPQGVLGITFSWGIIMAYAASQNTVSTQAITLYFSTIFWVIAYDTQYAMVDRDDDVLAGIQSSAILFGKHDRLMIILLQAAFIIMLTLVGIQNKLTPPYFISLAIAIIGFTHQNALTRHRNREGCFKAFLHNHWIGLVIFIGILLGK